MHIHDTTEAQASQVVFLKDAGKDGKTRPWALHRTEADYMAAAYDEFNPDKANRLRGCASWLEFAEGVDGRTLHDANFCRIRLCPICQWRRSLKIWSQTTDLVAAANKSRPGGCAWVMLTLTQKNVDDYMLAGELDSLFSAWNDFSRRKEFKRAVLGYMRVLEVTHNTEIQTHAYDTYHPHFHVLLAVRPSYFTSRDYIKHARWQQMWAEAMKLDYMPQVDVHRVYGNTAKAVAEVSKYATKPSDILTPEYWDVTVRTVELLDHDLNGRRLVAYGGLLRQLHQQLHLDSIENGDLIHTGTEDAAAAEVVRYVSYNWTIGYRQYVRGKVRTGGSPHAEKEKARCARAGTTPCERRAAIRELEAAGPAGVELVQRVSGQK